MIYEGCTPTKPHDTEDSSAKAGGSMPGEVSSKSSPGFLMKIVSNDIDNFYYAIEEYRNIGYVVIEKYETSIYKFNAILRKFW